MAKLNDIQELKQAKESKIQENDIEIIQTFFK